MARGNNLSKDRVLPNASTKERKVKQDSQKILLSYTGDLFIKQALAFTKEAKRRFEAGQEVEIKLEKVTAVDVAFVQTLFSVQRTMKEKIKSATIELNTDLAQLLKYTGLFAQLEKEGYNITTFDHDKK
ncbi:MAG: STAS domain-containing protein [Bacteroidota bacterium]